MYELPALASKEYVGLRDIELRVGRGVNGQISIFILQERMSNLSEGRVELTSIYAILAHG